MVLGAEKKTRSIKVLVEGLQFPEGPAVAQDGSLWAVELKGAALIQFHNGILKRYHVGGMPNGLAIAEDGLIWFCDSGQQSIRSFDTENNQTNTIATMVEDEHLNKPNDLAFDSKGNLVFTCPGESRREPTGNVCVLMKSGTSRKITDGKYFPNGLAFTKDGKQLVIAETYRHRLWKGEWNADEGSWTNEKIWCEIGGPNGPGGPDGMAFDMFGNLYVAVYGTGKIKVVNPVGVVIDEIELQGLNPTNCALEKPGGRGLFVTEAEKGHLLYVEIDKN